MSAAKPNVRFCLDGALGRRDSVPTIGSMLLEHLDTPDDARDVTPLFRNVSDRHVPARSAYSTGDQLAHDLLRLDHSLRDLLSVKEQEARHLVSTWQRRMHRRPRDEEILGSSPLADFMKRAAFRRLPPQSIRTCQVTSSPAWLPIRLPRSQGGHGCNGRNASRLPAGPGAASSIPRSIGSSASRIQNQSLFKRDRSLLKSGNGSIARPCRDPIWLRLTAAFWRVRFQAARSACASFRCISATVSAVKGPSAWSLG